MKFLATGCVSMWYIIQLRLYCFQGFQNDFKDAMDQVDQDYLKEILKMTDSQMRDSNDVKIRDAGTTYEGLMVCFAFPSRYFCSPSLSPDKVLQPTVTIETWKMISDNT